MKDQQPIFFIQEHLQEKAMDGGIGCVDAERIMLREGIRPIHFPRHYDFSFSAKLERLAFLLKCACSLPAGSILVFQYPLYARMNRLLLSLLRFRKSIRVICSVADINGLKLGDETQLKRDIRFFQRYRYFVVHNETMRSWLQQYVPKARMAVTSFFDFLAAPVATERSLSFEIAFAGNLYKSLFLEQLPGLTAAQPRLSFHIYGPNATAYMQDGPGIRYEGAYAPYEMPALLRGAFGLVWDGDGISGAEGSMGRYMHYISHHKLSLYLVSGLPVIVYDQAGSAPLVKKYGLGITIGSLYEIEEKIRSLSEEEYRSMCRNAREMGRKIASGDGLSTALSSLLSAMNAAAKH